MTPERLQQIRALAEGLRDDAAHDIEDKRDIHQALCDLIVEAEGLAYWMGVLAVVKQLPTCVADTRIVTDPNTGVSVLERLPQRFQVR